MAPKYQYVNGVCGSGKTYTAIKKIAARVKKGETIIYATETIKLLKQTQDGFENLGISCSLITSKEQIDWKSHYNQLIQEMKVALKSKGDVLSEAETVVKAHQLNYNLIERDEQVDWRREFKSVAQDVKASIELTSVSPRVILCTTKSLINAAASIASDIKLPLFIDEGFVVADSGEYISATSAEIRGLAAILKLTDDKPEDLSTNNRFQLPERLTALEQYVKNELYSVEYTTSAAKLNWVAHLNVKSLSTHFSDITLLAACHEDTLQYYAIKASGCTQNALDWGLATEHYTNGTIHVYWVLQDNEWRTTFKQKLKVSQLESIDSAFGLKHWSNDTLAVKGVAQGSKVLPVKSHGFNDVSTNHNYINLHTQMPANYFNSFLLEQYSMSKDDIRKAYYHYDCYQGAMRVSLRNSTKSKPRKDDNYFCFGDKATAKYFISKLASTVKVEQEKLVVLREDEATCTRVIDELEVKKTRSDKVSDSKKEQKNRGADRKKLLAIDPKLPRLDEALIYLRGWRRDNKDKRMTAILYEQVAKDFS